MQKLTWQFWAKVLARGWIRISLMRMYAADFRLICEFWPNKQSFSNPRIQKRPEPKHAIIYTVLLKHAATFSFWFCKSKNYVRWRKYRLIKNSGKRSVQPFGKIRASRLLRYTLANIFSQKKINLKKSIVKIYRIEFNRLFHW